jgi:hypothetical protein
MTETTGVTITASFNTRRQAELAVEHLVQELGIERTDIFLTPEGTENSAGSDAAGADVESGHPGVDPASDPALAGGISLSVDLASGEKISEIRSWFEEQGGEDIAVE